MSSLSKQERLELFKSLFRGRTDVFARRWEKYDGSVAGYAPMYSDWKKQSYALLTDAVFERHLLGEMVLGCYPLLADNTSHFIAADFDDEGWQTAALRFMQECKKHVLPVYLERSRSGNGGHVWCFFADAYPAYKSRHIFLSLLRASNNIDEFARNDSFDRLFPNQDYLSGKGLGNLIALPLQGQSRKEGNSVFVDHSSPTLEPYEDQWEFLARVERVPPVALDTIFEGLTENIAVERKKETRGELVITIGKYLELERSKVGPKLVTFLREELNFLNAEYIVKQRIGLSTHDLEKYFKVVRSEGDTVFVPRGFLQRLLGHLTEQGARFVLQDKRILVAPVSLTPSFNLLPHQKEALQSFTTTEAGVLVAPPGSGKTVTALQLIARKQQPALIITHRKQIFDQWLDRIESFFGIPRKQIGQFVGSKKTIATPITVAMMQSLARQLDWQQLRSSFGMVIVDECHHIPAQMFRAVVTELHPFYLFGLTATPKRKNNDEKLIYAYLGDIVHEIKRGFQKEGEEGRKTEGQATTEVVVRETAFSLPFLAKRTDYQMLLKILSSDTQRNALIAADVFAEVKLSHKCLILTERKEHVDILHFYLKRDCEVLAFTSDLTPKEKITKERQMKSGNFQVLIATGQLLGEGTDVPNLDCLFLTFPFSFEGKLIQHIGRIERGEITTKRVYDYRDKEVLLLDRMFKQRQRYYNKLKKSR